MGSIVLVDWTKHRLDCRPEIGIFPVTRLDIKANLRLASFIIEADLNRIEADLNLADLTVTAAVTVTRGFETAPPNTPFFLLLQNIRYLASK